MDPPQERRAGEEETCVLKLRALGKVWREKSKGCEVPGAGEVRGAQGLGLLSQLPLPLGHIPVYQGMALSMDDPGCNTPLSAQALLKLLILSSPAVFSASKLFMAAYSYL